MDLSIIIPCYNEELNLEPLMDECISVFGATNINVEYIFINDGSKDQTFKKIKELLNTKENIIGLNFSRNFGKEAAIYAGLKKARGKYISLMDADLQQHPKYVLKMYEYLQNHPEVDVVSCYQEKRKENVIIALFKKLFYKLINKFSDISFYENASDFRTFKKTVADSILELKEYYRFSKGFFSWVGYETHYMPYTVEKRKFGKTSWSFTSLFKYAIDGIVGFSISPLKLATFTGIITFFASLIYIIIVIIKKLTIGIDVSGYATIVCLILLFGGLQMIFIGIIGEYLGRVYMETKQRPIYIVKEEIRNDKEYL